MAGPDVFNSGGVLLSRPRERRGDVAPAHRHPAPTSDPEKNYQFGKMEGGSTGGYFAVRMKSDIIYETSHGVSSQRAARGVG